MRVIAIAVLLLFLSGSVGGQISVEPTVRDAKPTEIRIDKVVIECPRGYVVKRVFRYTGGVMLSYEPLEAHPTADRSDFSCIAEKHVKWLFADPRGGF